jgi:hypothetical protein
MQKMTAFLKSENGHFLAWLVREIPKTLMCRSAQLRDSCIIAFEEN